MMKLRLTLLLIITMTVVTITTATTMEEKETTTTTAIKHEEPSDVEWKTENVVVGYAMHTFNGVKYRVACFRHDGHANPVGIIEGDMIVSECERRRNPVHGALEWKLTHEESLAKYHPNQAWWQFTNYWPDGIMYYENSGSLDATTTKHVYMAIRSWKEQTVIRIVPRQSESAYILVQPGNGCSSNIGKVGNAQPINLLANGGCGVGSTIHEFGHAMGIMHEQKRTDRDTYITVNFGNMQDGASSQFVAGDTPVGPYDYGSIMHYGAYAFSSGGPTIVKDPTKYNEWKAATGYSTDIGYRGNLSPWDAEGANSKYEKCFTKPVSGKSAPFWDYTVVPTDNNAVVWTPCKSSCTAPGKRRLVYCRDKDGVCQDDSVCASMEKPMELDTRTCTNHGPSQVCNFEDHSCYMDPFHEDGQYPWTPTYDDGASSMSQRPTGDYAGGSSHWYYLFQKFQKPVGSTAVMASMPYAISAPTPMTFKYWYNYVGGGTSSKLEVYVDDCITGDHVDVLLKIDSSTTTAQAAWRDASVTLPVSTSGVIKFKVTTGSQAGDFAIDALFIDAGATVIVDPVTGEVTIVGGTVSGGELITPGTGVSTATKIAISVSIFVVFTVLVILFVGWKNKDRVERYMANAKNPTADVSIKGMRVNANPFKGTGLTTIGGGKWNTKSSSSARAAAAHTGASRPAAAHRTPVTRAPPPPPRNPAADGWIQCVSNEGYPYWFNEQTGASQWEAPQ